MMLHWFHCDNSRLLCERLFVFFTLANFAKKITSADPSNLLSSRG